MESMNIVNKHYQKQAEEEEEYFSNFVRRDKEVQVDFGDELPLSKLIKRSHLKK